MQLHGQGVDGAAISRAASEAQAALEQDLPTSSAVAVNKQCTPAKTIAAPIKDTAAQCGSTDGRNKISTSILVQYFSRANVIKVGAWALLPGVAFFVLLNLLSPSSHSLRFVHAAVSPVARHR